MASSLPGFLGNSLSPRALDFGLTVPACYRADVMRTADFDYTLPEELIAQHPAIRRDQSRLLVLNRSSSRIEHRQFPDLMEYLHAGDVLVLNNSRVIPARLRGENASTGGQFEILLLEENAVNDWWAMLRPGKRARIGTQIRLRQSVIPDLTATVTGLNAEGHRRLRFEGTPDILNELDAVGEIPLPPYIHRDAARPDLDAEDRERYQTVFARPPGSVAAPTAGLHFTDPLLHALRERGVEICFVTLHVGLGTFAPVKSESIADHAMHEERFEVSPETARVVNDAKRSGRRIIAVGTTTVRVLESANATLSPQLSGLSFLPSGSGRTRIFIHPPYQFRMVDALITNFHLPRSTLLMLVGAFAAPNETRGRDLVLTAYAEAVRERYRFFSYGDAMLLL